MNAWVDENWVRSRATLPLLWTCMYVLYARCAKVLMREREFIDCFFYPKYIHARTRMYVPFMFTEHSCLWSCVCKCISSVNKERELKTRPCIYSFNEHACLYKSYGNRSVWRENGEESLKNLMLMYILCVNFEWERIECMLPPSFLFLFSLIIFIHRLSAPLTPL